MADLSKNIGKVVRKSGSLFVCADISNPTSVISKLRHWIIPASTTGTAFRDSADGEAHSFQKAVLFQGFGGVLGTGWRESAFGTQGRGDHVLINTDQEDEWIAK